MHTILTCALTVLAAVAVGDLALYATLPTGGRNRRRH